MEPTPTVTIWRSAVIGAMLALPPAVAGCGGGDARPPDERVLEAGVLHFDAAMLARRDAGGPEHDAGLPPVDAGLPCDVGTSSDGVLTNHPGIRFTRTAGPLVLRTAFLEVAMGPSRTALIVYGEVENTGTYVECTPLPDFYVGFINLYPVFEGPAYNTSGTVSTVCLAPGERGVVSGIELDVSPSYLDSLPEVRYSMNSRAETFFTPDASSRPRIVSAETQTMGADTVIVGTASTVRPIRNVELMFLGRNACGLVFGEWSAYPEDFETSRIGTFAFETYPEAARRPGVPVDWLAYSSFIDDARRSSALVAPAGTPEDEARARRDEVRRRHAALGERR